MTSEAPGGTFPFRFGLALPTSGPFSQPDNIFGFAEHAERLGYDDVWVNDHLNFDWEQRFTTPVGTPEAVTDQPPNFYESLTTAAAVLGRFQRIGVGIGGLALPMRDPRWLAKQATSLHELTGRRLTLGPAVGMIQRSFDILGIAFEKRGRLFDEYLAALHELCYAQAPVSFEGKTLRFERANFYPRPSELRVLVAGESARAFKRVAQWGHGWLTSYPELDAYAESVRALRALVSDGGRDPDEIDTAALMFISLAPTAERALELSGPSLSSRFGSLERAQRTCIIGTTADAISRLLAFHDAGGRYAHLRPVVSSPSEWYEMAQQIAEDVLPAVRSAAR